MYMFYNKHVLHEDAEPVYMYVTSTLLKYTGITRREENQCGGMLPKKLKNLAPLRLFWGTTKLIAEMFLHVEINLI